MGHTVREPLREELHDLARRRPLFSDPPYQIRDLSAEHERRLNVGQRPADTVANGMGS